LVFLLVHRCLVLVLDSARFTGLSKNKEIKIKVKIITIIIIIMPTINTPSNFMLQRLYLCKCKFQP